MRRKLGCNEGWRGRSVTVLDRAKRAVDSRVLYGSGVWCRCDSEQYAASLSTEDGGEAVAMKEGKEVSLRGKEQRER